MTDRERLPIILYVCTDVDVYAGSSRSLYNMIRALKGIIQPIVLFPQNGTVPDIFRSEGIEVLAHSFYSVWEESKDSLADYVSRPRKTLLYKRIHDDFSCAKYVRRQLGDRKVSIVHTNTSNVTVGVTISHELKAKHVWHIREFGEAPFMGWRNMRRIVNMADARVCVSEAVRKHWRLKESGTSVIYNAIVPSRADECCMQKDRFLLFCSAVISPEKGDYIAVRAFCESGVWRDGYTLILVGRCPDEDKERLLGVAADCGADTGTVKFVGYQQCTSDYFRSATAFLMCSENEGLGRVTVESMYYGCPVIARRSEGGTLELVKPGETGFLFSTVEECAQKIKDVVMKTPYEIMSNATKFVTSRFTAEQYVPQILSVYGSICDAFKRL